MKVLIEKEEKREKEDVIKIKKTSISVTPKYNLEIILRKNNF